ncbi:PEP-CTERM sorting domain-containing protein [Roseateles sp.]|uniref:PEP-CTERM sorting domain-containing protein n=1 Tax=Roseateles sp. TaxID=1971397 RepID=UPI00326593EC
MHCVPRAAPFLALLVAASFAQAQAPSSVTADLTSIKVQLVDLTPDDGIAPSLTISQGGHVLAGLQTDARWLIDPSPLYIDQRLALDSFASAPPVGDGAVTLSVAGIEGSAQRVGSGLFAAVTGGEALATQSYAWWETFKTITQAPDGSPQWAGSFELGAGSAVTLTADYRMFASIAAGHGGAASATSALYGFVGTAGLDQLQRDQGSASIAAPGEQTFSGTLTLTLANSSATAVPVYFGAQASVYTEATSPVPEPGTVLMLLAGGLLIGWRARPNPLTCRRLDAGSGCCGHRIAV